MLDNKDFVIKFLMHHADPNLKEKFGNDALYYSIKNGNIDIFTILLKNGADVNSIYIDHKTPLICATLLKNEKMIREIMLKGGDPYAKDLNGESAISYAAKNDG